LGFTERMQNMKTVDLSGGWRMRVALACGLFIEPDILLLDEPTNHLDFPTVCWLGDYLQAYNPDKIVIVVSHEREFMNDVCTDIIHLHRCKLVYYKGNYAQFKKTRDEHRRHQAVQYKKQQREIAHQQDFIRRFAANKKWSTQAQSRRKVLAKMKRVEAVYNEQDWSFRFPEPEKLKNQMVLDVEDMGFSYFGAVDKSKFLLRDVDCRIVMGTKIGVIGANGAGKSTLLKLIMKELNPLEGKCFMRNEVTHGYFAQHHLETIDLEATPLQFLRSEFPNTSLQDCFQRLGRFNITPEDARKKISNLSGGEKSRLAFCILTWYQPHLVIMDEPTNHLDIQTQDALVNALQDYKGSLLVVSHDKHLLTNTCDEFWVIGNQTLTAFGNFDKATRFCYKRCKPVDVLPREFSKVEVKKGKDIGKRAKTVDPANILSGDTDKKKSKKEDEDEGGFIVDAERMLQRSIEKELKPKKYIIHLKGWKPKSGDFSPINIVSFDMMNKFLTDPNFIEADHFEFFESYQPLIEFLVPAEFIDIQIQLLKNTQSAWFTARGENFERARDDDSLMMILECFYQFQYVTDEALFAWKNLSDDKTIGREEAMQLLEDFFNDLEPPEEEVEAADPSVEVSGAASSI
jgi:ATPase subunit of ABC transporter with duplicated ATPase domains